MSEAAIRVERRGKSGGHTWHFLLDEGRTMCGRHTDDLVVVERADRDAFPALEACLGCLRFREGWTKPEHSGPPTKVTREPALGRVRTTGPLHHGFARRGGRRLK